MNITNTTIFWFLVAAIGGLAIAFIIGGYEGGTWAALWFVFVFIIGGIYTYFFQKKNP